MKRLPLLGFATLAFGIVALAAETIRFEPALNTITKYRITSQSTAEILSSSLTTSDGLPAPAAFKDILESVKSSLSGTTTQEITEKIASIETNGTRQLETNIVLSGMPPTPTMGYEMRSSLTPDGTLTISSIKFDAATLTQPGVADLGDSFLELIKISVAQQFPNIYGKPLDIGQTLSFVLPNVADTFTSAFKAIPGAKIEVQGLQANQSFTYQGRNTNNEYAFKTSSSITPGMFIIEMPSAFRLEQTLTQSQAEGEALYFPDGRFRSSRQNTTQVLSQIQKINLQPQVLTFAFSAETNTVVTAEILP